MREERPLAWIDTVFGAYCLSLSALAAHCWWRGECGPRTTLVFLAFAVANVLVSAAARRSARPAVVEAIRLLVGGVVAPLAYLAPEPPFERWWPAFLIMCVGGGVLQVLLHGRSAGRLLCGYYLCVFFLAEAFGGRADWHAFAIDAGATAAVGLLAVELVWVLSQAQRSKGQLAAIIESAPYPVATMALDGRLEYLNAAGRRLAGFEATGPLSGSLAMADLHADRERIAAGVAQAAQGRPWSGESVMAATPVFAAFFALPDSQGRPRQVAAVLRDVSARKRVEAELQEAKEAAEAALAESRRLSAVLEATPDMVCVADASGRMVYMNRSERRILGIGEHEDVQGLSVLDQYPPESAERVRNEALPWTATHGTWTGELERLTRDGRRIPVSLVGVALPGPDGAPAYLAAIARDMTERVRLESDLRQARDAAEAANRAKSTFLANMSHEIRTPMNAVIGMTGLLLGTGLDARQRDLVETIRTSGDALLDLINDILDFSKIEAGRMELESQAFDLRACVESAVDLLAPRAAEKGLALGYSMLPGVPEAIVGDVGRLRQVLVNLIGNAVKFTDAGEVVITVSVDEDESYLRFCVRDTGPGISAEQRARLFRPFTQLDGATTRQHGGTGLGLVISRRIAELMGGRLWVESEGPGRGSMFRFTTRAEPAPSPLRPWLRGRQPALHGRVLLIVENGPSTRRLLSQQTSTWGMSPVEAASASEALAVVRGGERFDAAILDVDIAGTSNGWELARQLRAVRDEESLPLVGLAAVGTDPAAHPDARLFHAFLTKPVKPSQLYDVLVGVFVGKAGAARPAHARTQPAAVEAPLADRLPLRILLAEDMPVNQKFALMALETMGYRADVAANGLEVLQALRRQRYDVVFMDMQMPQLDGAGATRRIREEWPAAEQPRIVAMTANAMQGDRELCLASGMDDYVSKPVYLHELRAALERCCTVAAG